MADNIFNVKGKGSLPVGVRGAMPVNPEEFARFLGLASWLMTMSKDHKDLAISELDTRILPAILLKQFRLIMKGKTPIAFLTWAMVSDDVLKRFKKSNQALDIRDWRSGKNLLIVDCVSPFGPGEKIKSEFLASMKPQNTTS